MVEAGGGLEGTGAGDGTGTGVSLPPCAEEVRLSDGAGDNASVGDSVLEVPESPSMPPPALEPDVASSTLMTMTGSSSSLRLLFLSDPLGVRTVRFSIAGGGGVSGSPGTGPLDGSAFESRTASERLTGTEFAFVPAVQTSGPLSAISSVMSVRRMMTVSSTTLAASPTVKGSPEKTNVPCNKVDDVCTNRGTVVRDAK